MQAMQISMFDYAALDTETRIVVQQRTSEIKALMKRAASDIIEIGQKLIEVKVRLGHGNFRPWLRMEFDWSQDTAQNFMNVALKFGKFPNLDGMAPSALYLLAAPSTSESARTEAIDRAAAGEPITYSRAREIVNDQAERDQEARRYDGYADIPAPDDLEDGSLTDYEEAITAQYTPAVLPRMSQPMSVLTSEGTTEWYTPPGIIERARAVLGTIDLDPASSHVAQEWIQATAYYTAGMTHEPWHGRVWLNPPFDDTPTWVDRLEAAYDAGDVQEAVLLVNTAPGYIWWEDLWRRRPVCMLRERLSFYTADGTPGGQAKKGTTIAYYGQNVARFIEQFTLLGRIILPED